MKARGFSGIEEVKNTCDENATILALMAAWSAGRWKSKAGASCCNEKYRCR